MSKIKVLTTATMKLRLVKLMFRWINNLFRYLFLNNSIFQLITLKPFLFKVYRSEILPKLCKKKPHIAVKLFWNLGVTKIKIACTI